MSEGLTPPPAANLGICAGCADRPDHNLDSIGDIAMGDKGSKDKGRRGKQNKAKVSLKEKRKLKQAKNNPKASALTPPQKGR